ncbi:GGDEF domain-containing protein [Herbaspirillum sp. CAH-3]|uniref:GGDEF domain-containing protein n=1 Tax=Herbaspirillum sp. CAH-3 TaxID=2605746 RepID=UPI0012AD0DF6|nr:GGDEF domain-containing protein [Herbaspirillum sp. CAH-3]MRT28982.1 GGDEF domain-containing protein [Herbaspirillum sp. CAH-3]
MNPFTASIALAIVQFCSGVIMTGLFISTPSERFTRLWALSGVFSALGICITVAVYSGLEGNLRLLGLLLGNTLVFSSGIVAWCGLRSFYQRQSRDWPCMIIIGYAVSFTGLLVGGADFTQRAFLAVGGLQLVFCLVLLEFFKGMSGPLAKRYPRWTFGRCTGIGALLILSATLVSRFVISLSHPELFMPPEMSNLGVALIYLIPISGSLLLSVSLMMIYFERLLADKQRLATEDELTGTLNRRELVRCGEEVLARAVQGGRVLTLAFIDVDHFKHINDTHGHLVGDRVLADIGALLREQCCQGGMVGRYGGEEFCAVFPDWSEAQARQIAQHLLETVRNHDFGHGQRVTISVGLAVLQPGQSMSWDALVHEADLALYRAKSEGRNAFRMALAA